MNTTLQQSLSTHDLGVVASIADKVAVMYAGEIVEYGTVEEIFYDPRHPYTWSLLSSLPQFRLMMKRSNVLFNSEVLPSRHLMINRKL